MIQFLILFCNVSIILIQNIEFTNEVKFYF